MQVVEKTRARSFLIEYFRHSFIDMSIFANALRPLQNAHLEGRGEILCRERTLLRMTTERARQCAESVSEWNVGGKFQSETQRLKKRRDVTSLRDRASQ